jgi:chemotaxis protein CheD
MSDGERTAPEGDAQPGAAPDPGDRERRYIHAGQVAAAPRPTAITTILGSCVAVCLFDPEAGVGGMNHFLLPHHVELERSPRFGSVAVPQLIAEVTKAGARRAALQAKLFGGASLIGAHRHRSLGAENAALAVRLLEEAGVPIVLQDVGGARGRKLIFHTDDGSAWVRRL